MKIGKLLLVLALFASSASAFAASLELRPGESRWVYDTLVSCGGGGGGGGHGGGGVQVERIHCWCQPDRGRGGDLVGWRRPYYRGGVAGPDEQVISTQVEWARPNAMGQCLENIRRYEPRCTFR